MPENFEKLPTSELKRIARELKFQDEPLPVDLYMELTNRGIDADLYSN